MNNNTKESRDDKGFLVDVTRHASSFPFAAVGVSTLAWERHFEAHSESEQKLCVILLILEFIFAVQKARRQGLSARAELLFKAQLPVDGRRDVFHGILDRYEEGSPGWTLLFLLPEELQ